MGLWLSKWAEHRFKQITGVRVISSHQWTPELAKDLAQAEAAIFIDCAMHCEPGLVRISQVAPATDTTKLGTHHLDAAQLLALSQQLYGSMPDSSLLLTVGAGGLELREGFSEAVQMALPECQRLLEDSVRRLLDSDQRA